MPHSFPFFFLNIDLSQLISKIEQSFNRIFSVINEHKSQFCELFNFLKSCDSLFLFDSGIFLVNKKYDKFLSSKIAN